MVVTVSIRRTKQSVFDNIDKSVFGRFAICSTTRLRRTAAKSRTRSFRKKLEPLREKTFFFLLLLLLRKSDRRYGYTPVRAVFFLYSWTRTNVRFVIKRDFSRQRFRDRTAYLLFISLRDVKNNDERTRASASGQNDRIRRGSKIGSILSFWKRRTIRPNAEFRFVRSAARFILESFSYREYCVRRGH